MCVFETITTFLATPMCSCCNVSTVALAFLVVLVTRFRHLIFGRSLAKLDVGPAPPEASMEWKRGENPGSARSLQDPRNPSLPKIVNFDPCSGHVLSESRVMNGAEVRAVVAEAREAQKTWAKTSFEQRRQVLRLLMNHIVANQEDICRVASRDTGKTMVDGAFGEVLTTCEKIAWTCENGEQCLRTEYRSVGSMMPHKRARVEYRPLGVLGAIIPWNYPFHNMLGQVISSIFSGNAVVIKVSEYACWSSDYYLKIVHSALKSLGHDPNIVRIVTGLGPTGAALCNSGVDKVTFIGSPAVGKIVMKQCADTLTPCVLELGGKDAAVVCDDCDYDQVVQLAMRGTYQNCGQNCIGLERLVVNEKIYDRLVDDLDKRVNSLRQGSPMQGDFDCGAMTMGENQIKGILAMVDDAVKNGARLLAGGRPAKVSGSQDGFFLTPTLLVDVTRDMKIATNEVFGPVMTVIKAKDDEDAISIVNGCEYGLGSSVFSLDYGRAERIAARLITGMCNLNDFGVNYLCQSLPFGGVNISGFDRFAGVEGLRGCCLMRSVTTDAFYGVRTTIPPPLQYPLDDNGFKFCESLVKMFYGNGLGERIWASLNLGLISLSKKKFA